MGNNNTLVYAPTEELDHLSEGYRIFCIVFQSILAATGTFGNLLTLIAVFSCKKLRRTHNAYIAHLAFVDLLISGFLVPVNIVGLYEHTSNDDTIGCQIIAILSLAALVASILSLFMVALNRYILICKGVHIYSKLYNKKTVPVSIIFIWTWAFIVVIPMLSFGGLGWSLKTHYCFFINYDFTTYIYMSVVLASAGVFIPATGTSICYMLIIKKLRATARRLAPKSVSSVVKEPIMTSSNSTSSTGHMVTIAAETTRVTITTTEVSSTADDEDDFGETDHMESKSKNGNAVAKTGMSAVNSEQWKRQRAKQRAHNRRVGGLILIFMIFMICWLPIAVTFTIDYLQQLPGLVYVTLISVAWINSCINVFLYAGTNQVYRHAFSCILKCKFSEINLRL